MATYKVWLTVKNSAGNTKEIAVGNIEVGADITTLTPEMLSQIEEALPLEDYLKKNDIGTELNTFATDEEVAQAVKNTVRYSDFKLVGENTEGTGE